MSGASEGGRRARKKAETRRRIVDSARALFMERGFVATTLDDIAAAADISKRSFFDYFRSKEDVVAAWQDDFKAMLIADVEARPASEPLLVAAERALISSLGRYDLEDARVHASLRFETATLQARDQLKYETLERELADALLKRATGSDSEMRARLVAMIVVGALRVSSEIYLRDAPTKSPAAAAETVVKLLRTEWENSG